MCPLFPGRRICGQAIVQREGAILKVPYLATAAEGDPWKRVRKSLLRRTQASGKQKGFHATSERDAQSMQDIIYLLRQKGRDGDDAIASECSNDWGGRGYDDFIPGEVTKTTPSGDRTT